MTDMDFAYRSVASNSLVGFINAAHAAGLVGLSPDIWNQLDDDATHQLRSMRTVKDNGHDWCVCEIVVKLKGGKYQRLQGLFIREDQFEVLDESSPAAWEQASMHQPGFK